MQKLAFGKLVNDEFKAKVIEISYKLNKLDPDFLMTCMAFETGEKFKSNVVNKQSNATGLIQFMKKTAIGLGTTIEDLAKMTEVKQLDYVYKYFQKYTSKLKTLGDVYMCILYPVAAGKDDNYVLFRKDDINAPKQYIQNKGLDFNKDGLITKKEVCDKIYRLYSKGMSETYYG